MNGFRVSLASTSMLQTVVLDNISQENANYLIMNGFSLSLVSTIMLSNCSLDNTISRGMFIIY